MRIKAIAVSTVAASVVIGLGALTPAFAYPPGHHLQLAASAQVTSAFHGRVSRFTVYAAVHNGKPGCTDHVSVAGEVAAAHIDSHGNGRAVLYIHGSAGRYVAGVYDPCSRESARSSFVVVGWRMYLNSHRGSRRISATGVGWLPNTSLRCTVTNGRRTASSSGRANSAGKFSLTLTAPAFGRWAVVCSQSGRSDSTNILLT